MNKTFYQIRNTHFNHNWSDQKTHITFLPKLVQLEIACDVSTKTGLIRKCMLHFYQNWSVQFEIACDVSTKIGLIGKSISHFYQTWSIRINQFWYD